MNKVKVLGAVIALSFLAAVTVQAAEFIAPASKTDSNVSTLQKETHKNLYIAGANVTVNSQTKGDLAAAGGVVTVNGDVEKDLLVAGGNLNINGSVGETARIAGGNISISGPVNGDLVVAGGNISVAQKASIGGDLVIGGGNISVDSDVTGNLKIGGGEVTINGKVSGNVIEIMASKSLTFGSNAEVSGKISFKGPVEAVVMPGAKVGPIEFTKVNKQVAQKGGFAGMMIIGSIFKFLMLLAAGLVLVWLFPAKVASVVKEALARPWHDLGIGFAVLVVLPILAIILMITVVGVYLGLIVMLSYGLLLVISSVLVMFYTGRLVWGWYQKNAGPNHWRDLGVGAVIMLLLGLIPIVGWIVLFGLWLITLGAFASHHWQQETTQK
ncbi:MAG: hypothetical protein ABI643_02375 [Candidatus Doudnabacteria bacterium]